MKRLTKYEKETILLTPEGSVTYTVDKARVSVRLIPPYSEARLQKASENAKRNGFISVQGGLRRTA